jgi:hypothetical protein
MDLVLFDTAQHQASVAKATSASTAGLSGPCTVTK